MAYFGSRHTATAEEKHDALFRCASCGIERHARARGTGVGTARSPYFLDEAGARGRAEEDAYSSAVEAAELALQIVPCPVCGKRNPVPAKAYLRTSWSTGILIFGSLSALGGVLALSGVGIAGAASLVVGMVFGGLYALGRKKAWDNAVHVVEFFEGEAPDSPFLGKPCGQCTKKLFTIDEGTRCKHCGVPLHRKKCKKAHRLEKHPSD